MVVGLVGTLLLDCASSPQVSAPKTTTAEPARSLAQPSQTGKPKRPSAQPPNADGANTSLSAPGVNWSAGPAARGAATTDPITDSDLMRALEAEGLGLERLFGDVLARSKGANSVRPSDSAPNSLAAFAEHPGWQPLLDAIRREVDRVRASDPNAGVSVARYSHRVFDVEFLRSTVARFELVGVVNRLDRAPLVPDSCGEVRLVYRLSYAAGKRASRLPLTLGVELPVQRNGEGCTTAAQHWQEPAHVSAQARAHWFTRQGPLQPSLLAPALSRARVVVNAQIVRWPSTVRPDLGGHAEYLLAAFRIDAAGVLQPEGLENTIDAAALQRDPARRKRLLAWLTDPAHLPSIAAGSVDIPDEFLATRAISVTPRGSTRLQNRPFSGLFKLSELDNLDLSAFEYTKTPEALLRRLDQLSCQGCHQARSVAGFHLLGEDPSGSPSENSLAVPISAHVSEDSSRRAAVSATWLRGETPRASAPLAEHGQDALGSPGAHCTLGPDPSYADWTCAAGLKCVQLDGAAGEAIGRCVGAEPSVGDACELGLAKPALNAHADRVVSNGRLPCPGDDVCNRSNVGFPGGMCTAHCGEAGAVCGSIAILDPFNACLARGGVFIDCIRDNVTPAGLRPCGSGKPCRDDYVCAQTPAGGACIPPYFVFQLRVDGHTLP